MNLKQLREMARKMVAQLTTDLDSEHYRAHNYESYTRHPKMTTFGNFSIHKKEHHSVVNSPIELTTLDNKNKEVVHKSTILTKQANKHFPYDHQEQVGVERKKHSGQDDLPKGHATNVIYQHFLHSDFPLKSSTQQYSNGHQMWHRLVHKALDDGHSVYHYDGSKLHKTTKDTAEEHFKKAFGDSEEHFNKHMIISKKELT